LRNTEAVSCSLPCAKSTLPPSSKLVAVCGATLQGSPSKVVLVTPQPLRTVDEAGVLLLP
jgi:hypothetical protein